MDADSDCRRYYGNGSAACLSFSVMYPTSAEQMRIAGCDHCWLGLHRNVATETAFHKFNRRFQRRHEWFAENTKMIIQVQTVVGPTGLHEPHAFTLGDKRIAVEIITDRWISTDHSYFKLTANDSANYILRHDENSGEWEMTLFQAPRE